MSIWDEQAEVDGDGRTGHLARSDRDKVVFGVCGGIGEATGLDPLVLRLAMIVLAFTAGGVVIPAYIIAGLVMRRPGSGGSSTRHHRRASKVSIGWMLVICGAFLVLQQLHFINTLLVAAVVMVVLGINLVVRHRH